MEVHEVNQTQVSHMVQVWAEGPEVPEVPEAARPERAEALKYRTIYKAFALTGRLADCHCTQGDALG
nr:hypothetical protein [uncultured Prevotella sp.]